MNTTAKTRYLEDLFKEHYVHNKALYSTSIWEAVTDAIEVAKSYYEHKSPEEVEADEASNITQQDYIDTCVDKALQFLTDDLNIITIPQLEAYTGEDIMGKYDFDRDLYDDDTLSFSYSMDVDRYTVNFRFHVDVKNKWQSRLTLIAIETI